MKMPSGGFNFEDGPRGGGSLDDLRLVLAVTGEDEFNDLARGG
jgi:hypothetical protein